MTKNPLLQLRDQGQSVWLDTISREIITSGQLKRLMEEDGLAGVTSNPAIFEKAISEGKEYREQIRTLARAGKGPAEIYEALAVQDIQMACDTLRPVYERAEGHDGFVSLEVSPELAFDTQATIAEVRRLWREVDRPNLLVKIPATDPGLPAIRQMLAEGHNINITLLFSLQDYIRVAEAYVDALEERAKAGKPVDRIASVASFFVSRIDTLADQWLEKRFTETGDARAQSFLGKVAIANAKLAYQHYLRIFGSERFRKLEEKGARVQRVLWASTSTKNPKYSDVMYVEALIGPNTVNTMPLETINAFRDHGKVARTVDQDVAEAQRIIDSLAEVGISYDALTRQLQQEGVEKFVQPFRKLMQRITEVRDELLAGAKA